MPSSVEIAPFEREHLPGVLALFASERWSYAEDEQRTWRTLTAPGSLSLVALSTERTIVGIAQVLSDGEIQAFLAVLVVAAANRAKASRAGSCRRRSLALAAPGWM